MERSDIGAYYCVSKNTMGIQRIKFTIHKEKVSYGPDGNNPVVNGETAYLPNYGEIDECVQVPCKECPQPK